jgi:hypothetical protein
MRKKTQRPGSAVIRRRSIDLLTGKSVVEGTSDLRRTPTPTQTQTSMPVSVPVPAPVPASMPAHDISGTVEAHEKEDGQHQHAAELPAPPMPAGHLHVSSTEIAEALASSPPPSPAVAQIRRSRSDPIPEGNTLKSVDQLPVLAPSGPSASTRDKEVSQNDERPEANDDGDMELEDRYLLPLSSQRTETGRRPSRMYNSGTRVRRNSVSTITDSCYRGSDTSDSDENDVYSDLEGNDATVSILPLRSHHICDPVMFLVITN